MNEFSIIKTYFAEQTAKRSDVLLGIGDDAALVNIPTDKTLAITTDTLVANVHFFADTDPENLGYKSLAVNLSDLAAMGATPAWITLNLTLPQANEAWLKSFCQGLFSLAKEFNVQLIGGDLTQGPLTISIQAIGLLPRDKALTRQQAQVGDSIYVTGTLGDAGLALHYLQNNNFSLPTTLLQRLQRPQPRVPAGERLLSLANAAIDISDGLAADLSHILEESQVGARVNVDELPLSAELKKLVDIQQAITLALTAGDDYELCFTVAEKNRAEVEKQLTMIACPYTCIGQITAEAGLQLQYRDGKLYQGKTDGFQHF